MLTQSKLKETLSYDPETGIFIWLVKPCNRIRIGSIAGYCGSGYRQISVDGKLYQAHRLAFLYLTGSFPVGDIDHIDHVKDNNQWSNIRTVTKKENSKNQSISKRNKSGVTGVNWNKQTSKWQSSIQVDGKFKYLGTFADKNKAIAARAAANIKYGYHSNHGQLQSSSQI